MSDINYNKLPELIPEEIIKRASKLSSAQLADGMKSMGIHRDGCMDACIMPVNENMRTIGTSYTVSTDNGDNLPIHVAIYQGQPGYVLVISGKGHIDHAYIGDLLVSAADAIGLKGIIVDGYVRDKATLVELGMPVFSKGFTQRGPIKKDPGEINTEIVCGGVKVRPGDLIIGDCDGVTVVPRDLVEIVLKHAEKKGVYEVQRRALINEYKKCKLEGNETPNLTPRWVSEMSDKLKISL